MADEAPLFRAPVPVLELEPLNGKRQEGGGAGGGGRGRGSESVVDPWEVVAAWLIGVFPWFGVDLGKLNLRFLLATE